MKWRAPPAGRASVVEQMAGRFYMPQLENPPAHFRASGENNLSFCSDNESSESWEDLVVTKRPSKESSARGRWKMAPRAHTYKFLTKSSDSAPMTAVGVPPPKDKKKDTSEDVQEEVEEQPESP